MSRDNENDEELKIVGGLSHDIATSRARKVRQTTSEKNKKNETPAGDGQSTPPKGELIGTAQVSMTTPENKKSGSGSTGSDSKELRNASTRDEPQAQSGSGDSNGYSSGKDGGVREVGAGGVRGGKVEAGDGGNGGVRGGIGGLGGFTLDLSGSPAREPSFSPEKVKAPVKLTRVAKPSSKTRAEPGVAYPAELSGRAVARTFGSLALVRMTISGRSCDFFEIECEPHVSIRFKNVFSQVVKSRAGKLRISVSIQNCKDLEWFLQRYPMLVSKESLEVLQKGCSDYGDKQEALEQIFLPDYQPRKIEGLAISLRDYQSRAVELLLGAKRLLLGDDVGLGKTAVGIGAVAAEPATLPALVVCQTHLPGQWMSQFKKFAPNLSVHIIHARKPYNLPKVDVYVMSYSKLSGWVDLLTKGFFRSVILDEVQELRLSTSQKYEAAVQATRKADYVIGLSATPVYNYGGEIFSVVDAISEGALGTYDEFMQAWCQGGNYAGNKVKVNDPKALGAFLRENHLLLRRTREEVGRELPPVNRIVHEVEYNEGMVKKMEATLKDIAARVIEGSFVERGQAARELDMRARMMTGIAKAHGVADYVRVLLENGEKVVLAAWHREVYRIYLEELAEYKPVMYTGSESPQQKEEARRSFVDGDSQLMILSLRSGVGLDSLQDVCNIVCFGELDWSPGVLEQVQGRLRRDGQKEQVTSIYLVTQSGTDPLMVEMLGLKATQAHGIMNPQNKDIVENFSDDERIKILARNILERN